MICLIRESQQRELAESWKRLMARPYLSDRHSSRRMSVDEIDSCDVYKVYGTQFFSVVLTYVMF